jgi:hypothetical protein
MIATHPVPRSAGLALTLAALLSLVLSACAGVPSTPAASPPDATPVPANSASDIAGAPSEVSNLPAGVYRTEITVASLRKLGVDDPQGAGIWTFTVHPGGAYEVACASIDSPGIDCGNRDPTNPEIQEVGDLRGTSPTWFVLDTERLVKLTGCSPHSEGELDYCGPGGGYHVRWKRTPKGLEFTDWVGVGVLAGDSPVNSWTVQPWTRIS